jgi:hypothetical protein
MEVVPMEVATNAAGSALAEILAQHKAWLVGKGDELGRKARLNRDWASQARVLLEAARSETEPAVLLNLLRYQRARNQNWVTPANVFAPLEQAMNDCVTRAAQAPAGALELMRHLLVYTLRAYTYESKLAEEERRQGRPAS